MAVRGAALPEAKQDAALVWLKEQEDAGIDVVGVAGRPPRARAQLRIMFEGGDDYEGLEEISSEHFFATFEESELAFPDREETKDGSEGRFFKRVARD